MLARLICVDLHVEQVTVSVEKPSALPFVAGAGVEITRTRDWLKELDKESESIMSS